MKGITHICRLVTLLTSFIVIGNVAAQKKVAFIIGNGDYSYDNVDNARFSSLSTPLNDADRMDSELKSLGYETLLIKDATRDDMINACEKFEPLCTNSDIAIFYYSGHAITINGRYYLVPCKTKLASISFLESKCLEVSEISNFLKGKSKRSIMFLDACRDEITRSNMYANISEVETSNNDDKNEQMTFYATAKGQKAISGNGPLSPFTDVLSKHLKDKQNLKDIWNTSIIPEVRELTNNQQTPEIAGMFSTPFYLYLDSNDTLDQSNQNADSSDSFDLSDMVQLGKCYYFGRGVEKDYAKAFEIFKKATNVNNVDAEAQFMLGCCYMEGNGVAKDPVKAVEWYSKAAENKYAQNNLGYCYLEGIGVAKDPAKAVELFLLSAKQEYVVAKYNLFYCYSNGIGVEKNIKEAIDWCKEAAKQGYRDAIEELIKLGIW